jgi:hypothetical protein
MQALVIYSLLGIAALAYGIWSLSNRDSMAGTIYCIVGGLFIWNVLASQNNSAAPVIERNAIRIVKAHAPHPPATRGYFSVVFEENGKERRRLIMLPGSMSGGQKEYKRALEVMRASGLPFEE